MSTVPVGATAAPSVATPPSDYVTITQPDGTKIRIPGIQAKWDPISKAWTVDVSAERAAAGKTANAASSNNLKADDFMKLLVAQLKYQDPSKPADTAEMMQQTASMSMVERVNEMAASTEKLAKAADTMTSAAAANNQAYATMLMEQRMSSAVTLVGRTITYADAANPNTKVSGVVDSVRFDEKGPILVVGGKDVPLAAVSSVKAPTTTPSSTSTGGA